MADDDAGIGVLARLTGHDATDMRRDRRKLAGGLLALGSEAVSLIRGYASDDPGVRQAAYRRWAELDAMLPRPDPSAPPGPPGLTDEQREALRVALSDAVAKLQELERDVMDRPPSESRASGHSGDATD